MHSIGHIVWKDPNKWMEAMRGSRWKDRMAKENKAFLEEVAAVATVEEQVAVAKRFEANSKESDANFTYDVRDGSTHIRVTEQGSILQWKWDVSGEIHKQVGDLDLVDGVVVYSEDVKEGGHHYKISAVTMKKTMWTFDGKGRHGLSSDVAILGGRVYCLEAAAPLKYKWLVSIDLQTGRDRRVHYMEENASVSLELIRAENQCLFLLAENAGRQALYHIGSKGNVKRVCREGISFFPVGYGPRSQEPCYFFRRDLAAPWECEGAALQGLGSKKILNHGIDLVCLRDRVLVHRDHGHHHIEGTHTSFWGEIRENPWGRWKGGAVDLRLCVPGCTAVKGRYKGGLLFDPPDTMYADLLRHGKAKSLDGTWVRWLGVCSSIRPCRGLLIVGYGAYGSSTPVDTTRWRPYLDAGFALGFAFIRGGGDHNDAWAAAGRLAGKERGVEDFEACVRALQRETGIGPKHTCIFGRSAGGYLIGLTLLRNPGGELARCVYTEAPYVDVLQTSCNSALPLTVFEYMEFGDPAHSLADFEMLLRLSPVGGTGPEGAPGVFVLCRVGLNDRQVFAYESVKWMDVLRGTGATQSERKILYLTKGIGHNAHGTLVAKERAEDFLVLSNKVLGVNR
jgi:hypothetical protein